MPITARLLNRSGQPIATLPVAPSAQGGDVREIDVALTSVPPGEYLIEIAAGSQTTPVQEVIGFRITG
jgi:hypothetical protein